MRKLTLLAASCIALVAYLGLSSQAFATIDPDCDGTPYNNDKLMHDFTIKTPDSNMQHFVSGVTGGALACGTNLTLFGGDGTLYDHPDVSLPPGVDVNNTSNIPNGSYAGDSTVSVIYRILLVGTRYQSGVPATVTTDSISECERENAAVVQHPGHPTGTIVACLKGAGSIGHNWSWTTQNTQTGRYSITIGPMHAIGDITDPGLTRISLSLCGYAGAVGGSSCGDGSDDSLWLQKNGDGSYPDCSNGNGTYTATATNKDAFTTPPVSTCVSWLTTPGQDCQSASTRKPPCINVHGSPRSRG